MVFAQGDSTDSTVSMVLNLLAYEKTSKFHHAQLSGRWGVETIKLNSSSGSTILNFIPLIQSTHKNALGGREKVCEQKA